MRLQILYNFALIKPLEDTGGLAVPEGDKKAKRGKVIKIAPVFLEPFGRVSSDIKEGDIVYYPNFSEQPVRIEDEPFVMVRINEIYGVEKDESNVA
jgi:co-chaperonin GroES (HSP10)